MAVYAAIPCQIELGTHRNSSSKGFFLPRASYIDYQQRKCSTCLKFSWGKDPKLSALHILKPKVNSSPENYFSRHCCVGNLLSSDGYSAPEWVSVVDQVLLAASMGLTYVAGAVPARKMPMTSQAGISNDENALPGDLAFPGRYTRDKDEVNSKLPWDILEDKLMNALNDIEGKENLGSRSIQFEQDHSKPSLSLLAIAEGPRFQLMWTVFQWLKKEVHTISERAGNVTKDTWSPVLSETLQKFCQPVCMAWLEEQLSLKSRKLDKELLSLLVEKLSKDESILDNIKKSGKEDLYAELTQFFVRGFLSEGCCYSSSFFTQHGVSILEDLVITLADGIASVYLELVSVDSNISNEISSLGLVLCTLSTRELQKLRNEVALRRWLHQNMDAVVSMYEDRFDLRTLQMKIIEKSSETESGKFNWLKRFSLRRSASVSSSSRTFLLSSISVTVKRTKELRALIGWRYYFSLYLELADITIPMMRTVVAKVSEAISFFLVCLIGRSLGLIYTGIRQSLRWK